MFKSLQEYYDYVEADKNLITDLHLSGKIAHLHSNLVSDQEKICCEYEAYFMDFLIELGKLVPKLTYQDGQTFPHLGMFQDDLAYIKLRAENVNNPKYKARYNHFMWLGGNKHNLYAKRAIDNYLITLRNATFAETDVLSQLAFTNNFKNLFILCQTINYKKEEAVDFLKTTLGTKKINGFKECSLINLVVSEGKKIDQSVFQFFYDYNGRVVNETGNDVRLLEEYLNLQIQLSQKLGIPAKGHYDKLAEFYMMQADDRKENFLSHHFYMKALELFQKAGNKEKIEEASVLIEGAKKNLNFKSIKVEYTDERLQEYWEKLIKMIDVITDKGESKEIYEYLILYDSIFPKSELLDDNVRPMMFDIVTVTNFDINKNISNSQQSGINSYFIHLQNFTLPHLQNIFLKGIEKGKISFSSLINYLKDHTWYGQDFTFLNEHNEIEGFNWIELLSPSLENFFLQSEVDIKTKKNSAEGYILSIDSLTIKFEGLLREFSKRIGAQTIEIKAGSTGERISFEKLLENENLCTLIRKDDLALFKFLFTDKGMNLRNNIAHCFYNTQRYSAGIMFLLIAALLKLGSYELSSTSSTLS